MKEARFPILLMVAFAVCALPCATVRSQALPAAPADPLAALQALQTANDDLLKRQEATLKELSDITADAREAKIFAKRG